MPTQKLTNEIITAAIEGFEAQKKRIDEHIAELRNSLTAGPAAAVAAPRETRRRGKFSAATRLKMKEAQQRRWARIKGAADPSMATAAAAKPKRQMSEAGRQAIADAVRRRWAAKKAENVSAKSAATKQATRKKAAAKKTVGKKAATNVATE
jgi:hypothetical protein